MEPLFLHCAECVASRGRTDGYDVFIDQEQNNSPLYIACRLCGKEVAALKMDRGACTHGDSLVEL